MISRGADDCPIGRQVAERRIEPLDRLLLDERILGVPGGVGRLLVAEDEGVAGVQPLPRELDSRHEVRNRVVRLRRLQRLQPQSRAQAS